MGLIGLMYSELRFTGPSFPPLRGCFIFAMQRTRASPG